MVASGSPLLGDEGIALASVRDHLEDSNKNYSRWLQTLTGRDILWWNNQIMERSLEWRNSAYKFQLSNSFHSIGALHCFTVLSVILQCWLETVWWPLLVLTSQHCHWLICRAHCLVVMMLPVLLLVLPPLISPCCYCRTVWPVLDWLVSLGPPVSSPGMELPCCPHRTTPHRTTPHHTTGRSGGQLAAPRAGLDWGRRGPAISGLRRLHGAVSRQ